jgi:glycosyltransferase involved in cell wall biosynthesis
MLRMGAASDRGYLLHLAYLLEALMLLDHAQEEMLVHIHAHFGTNSATVALLTSLLGGPTFSMTVHGPEEFDSAIGWSLDTKLRHATFAAAISSFGAAQLRRWVDPPFWPRIQVIHCTVDEDWFSNSHPVRPEADTYVCVGRLSAQKGQLLLLDALRDAIDAGFQGHLVLVGDGELRDHIEERIRDLDLADRVALTGALDGAAIRKHLDEARALVLPSFAEGLPVVLMEAMARARPVLTTTIMGIPELVRDGQEGWLVCAGDREALTQALLDVDRTSADRLTEMGRAGQERVRSRHTSDAVIPALSELLERAVVSAAVPGDDPKGV